MEKHIKVLSALSIADSDAREDTLKSVILKTIHTAKSVRCEKLSEEIYNQFNFTPYQSELESLLTKLIEDKIVSKTAGNLSLSLVEKQKILKLESSLNDKEKLRFQNFKNFIKDQLEYDIPINKIKILWGTFLSYIYNSFYEYGHEALKTLHPHIESSISNGTYANVLKDISATLGPENSELIPIFNEVVNRFSDFASNDDLDFLNDLAQKTLSFSTLGIRPELAANSIDRDIVDWILYLDTNVIFSILKLHSHPENQACRALIQLLIDNKDYIKIKLRYATITYKELISIKDDFGSLNLNLTDSAIKAILKSNRLDSFATQFYSNLLENRENAIHPKKIIELASTTLKHKEIEIGRTDARIGHINESLINAEISDYYLFMEDKNVIREEFATKKGVAFHPTIKGEKQVRHDITLRELILDYRNLDDDQEPSLNNVKYFGLSLDETLIRFDRKKTKERQDKYSFPVFFKPSFLLNKLQRILPIQTPDYKQAFLKAITTKGFYKDAKQSQNILSIVNYLKAQGIDNEEVIYNIVTQDIFLEKYSKKKEKAEFDEGEFINSEINRQFNEAQSKLANAEDELIQVRTDSTLSQKEKEEALMKKEHYEMLFQQYEKAASSLTQRIKRLEKNADNIGKQKSLDFEGEEEKNKLQLENVKYKKLYKKQIEEEIEDYKIKELKRWQKKIWWHLLWVIPSLIFSGLVTFSSPYNPLEIIGMNTEKIVNIIVGTVLLLINIILVSLIRYRYFNESSKKAKFDKIKLSPELISKLENVD